MKKRNQYFDIIFGAMLLMDTLEILEREDKVGSIWGM